MNGKKTSCVIRNCEFCSNFIHEEIGDSDFGGIFADEPSCLKYYDLEDNSNELIKNFDRNIERECCDLDFWSVLEADDVLSKKFSEITNGGSHDINEVYELFNERYPKTK